MEDHQAKGNLRKCDKKSGMAWKQAQPEATVQAPNGHEVFEILFRPVGTKHLCWSKFYRNLQVHAESQRAELAIIKLRTIDCLVPFVVYMSEAPVVML